MMDVLKITKRMTPVLAVLCLLATGSASAQEENYYLEKMRQQSQADSGQPAVAIPEQDNNLLAETDLLDLTEGDEELSDIDSVQPDFDKPKLELFKPEL